MSLLDALINIQITAQTKVPTVQGFGTPLLLAYHTKYGDLLKAYLDLDGLVADGFSVNSSVYKMATKMLSQVPHPPLFYVGRRQLPFTQVIELTLCNTGALSYSYEFTITDDLGHAYPVTLASTGVVATDAASILALLNAEPVTYQHISTSLWTAPAAYAPYIRNGQIVQVGGTPPTGYSTLTNYYMINVSGLTFQLSATAGGSVVTAATDNGTSVTLKTVIDKCAITNPSGGKLRFTQTAGYMIDITGLPVPAKVGALGTITMANTTADPGIVSDLVAIEAVDNTSWYGVLCDSNGKAEVEALAAHIETQTKIFGYTTNDSDCADNSVSTDVFSVLQALGYTRTIGQFLANESESYSMVGWMCNRLSTQPGAANWAYCSIVGVTNDDNLGGIVATIVSIAGAASKRGNVYVNLAGVGATLFGVTPSGEFIDLPIFIDWVRVNMQARIYIRLLNASAAGSKVAYTDDGVAQIGQDVSAQLAAGADPKGPNPGIVPGSIVIVLPKVATMSPVDKANRKYGPITFSFQYTGAINQLTVTGSVTL